MDENESWFETAWEKLNEDYKKGGFTPRGESDIMCHLYSKLLQTKNWRLDDRRDVLTCYGYKLPNHDKRSHVDLVIGEWERKDFRIHIAIEIKESGHNLGGKEFNKLKSLRERYLKRDLKKLEEVGRKEKKNSNCIKKYMIFFFSKRFQNEKEKAIPEPYRKKLEAIRQGDIVFKWGPC